MLEPAQRDPAAVDVAGQRGQRRRELAPLRPEVAVHRHGEQRRRAPGPHQMRKQEEGRLVGPLQVVEDEQHRMASRDPPDPGVDRLEQPEALGLGRRLGRGRGADPVRGLRAEPGDLLRQAGQVAAQQRLRAGPRVVVQGLAERLVRGEHVLVPAPVQHQSAVRAHQPRQLGRERRLPDPRLPGDERQYPAARLRGRPRLPQNAEFLLAIHECRLAADSIHTTFEASASSGRRARPAGRRPRGHRRRRGRAGRRRLSGRAWPGGRHPAVSRACGGRPP